MIMRTKIKTIHEETNTNSETNVSIGVLYNNSQDHKVYDVLFFRFKKNTYIFFKTITDLIDYTLYGEGDGIERSYVSEEDFDRCYDEQIDGLFRDKITWCK
jgi:hypothetical protein